MHSFSYHNVMDRRKELLKQYRALFALHAIKNPGSVPLVHIRFTEHFIERCSWSGVCFRAGDNSDEQNAMMIRRLMRLQHNALK